MESLKNPNVLKMCAKLKKYVKNGHLVENTLKQNSCHGNLTRLRSSTLPLFLPFKDSPGGLPKLKFVESTVFEIMGGGVGLTPPPFVEGVDTKYLRTGRVNILPKLSIT